MFSEAPVYAVANGVVRFAALAQLGYGYVVIIEHKLPSGDPAGEYVCTVYGHLKQEGLTSIRHVSKGELIGYLSEDPEYNKGIIHLHFGIRKGPYIETVIDPRREGWYYGGSTAIFGEECNRENPIHLQILSEWVNPTTDQVNGEGFINTHSSLTRTSQTRAQDRNNTYNLSLSYAKESPCTVVLGYNCGVTLAW